MIVQKVAMVRKAILPMSGIIQGSSITTMGGMNAKAAFGKGKSVPPSPELLPLPLPLLFYGLHCSSSGNQMHSSSLKSAILQSVSLKVLAYL